MLNRLTGLEIGKLFNDMDFSIVLFDLIQFISRCTREITLERQKTLDTFPLSGKKIIFAEAICLIFFLFLFQSYFIRFDRANIRQ